jgi:predicted dehydrogenase
MRLAVIGAGNMGGNHARAVKESSRATLEVVIDRDLVRARTTAKQFGATASVDLDRAFGCDAAIVASTTASHLEVALPLLEAGVPVLVEKPLAPDPESVYRLVEASAELDVPIMCGFVERFNPALSAVFSMLDEPVVHLHTVRHSPFNPRACSDVVTDLLIHDIDTAVRLAADDSQPKVSASQWMPDGSGVSELSDCVLQFSGGMTANLSASRWSQRKIRDIRVATDQSLYEIDLLRVTLTVYQHVRHWAEFGDSRSYRAETVVDVPFVRQTGEPIGAQLDHFLDLVEGKQDAAAERRSILPPHEIAARIAHQ